jgi:hypothetical protein
MEVWRYGDMTIVLVSSFRFSAATVPSSGGVVEDQGG